MKLYACPACGGTLYFENLVCACGQEVAYDPQADRMVALAAPCANRREVGCNWIAEAPDGRCRSCAMTLTRPDEDAPGALSLWSRSEAAKRWVLANMMSLGWFGDDDPGPRPTFDMLAERTAAGPAQPVMGHANGHITLNIAEADPAEIVERRERMGEPYRTVIGHCRHELAHFLFERLAGRPGFFDAARAVFGDEREDYAAALERHYAAGPPPDWAERHVSPYASSHPHEDWAETAAHALHLRDVVESARATGLQMPAAGGAAARAEADDDGDGDGADQAEAVIAEGIDLGIALNHVNRAMGLEDVYPFVVSPAARQKLIFAQRVIAAGPVDLGPVEATDGSS
ncbi:MAG: putative zinc-binding metallopeptidase [Pseudomonadota bacterium]